ncbi:uncharacterized protein LOC114333353 isoform X13 [Diabrotica virgifera virgifera]|uniref:Uncharacterized protein n=1 Tax=Diabrotica virgifera virgifera TaxID=50390 RepID=A0ABM5JN13_DIAVI|nr:uncharacterized protein LOC114333353 isoform X13 [Diabrotica virgifera virgifera]
MKVPFLFITVLGCSLASPNGYYHQEYNYKTSQSSYKNNELQHKTDDQGYYKKDGDLENRYKPIEDSNSEHSEYINPKLQNGQYGLDTNSYGHMRADGTYGYGNQNSMGVEGLARNDRIYGSQAGYSAGYGSSNSHSYSTNSNLRMLTSRLQQELERDLQEAVRQNSAYSQSRIDMTELERELRRNLTERLNNELNLKYGQQIVRSGMSYSMSGGRLQPTANYDNQELVDLKSQIENTLLNQLRTQYSQYSQQSSYGSSNSYQHNGGAYVYPVTQRPVYYTTTYRPIYPTLTSGGYVDTHNQQYNTVKTRYTPIANPESLTSIASRVQSQLDANLNNVLDETRRTHFSSSQQYSLTNPDALLERLRNELRNNITYQLDDMISKNYGSQTQKDGYLYSVGSNGAISTDYNYGLRDMENLKEQIQRNLINKLERDFESSRKSWSSSSSYSSQSSYGNTYGSAQPAYYQPGVKAGYNSGSEYNSASRYNSASGYNTANQHNSASGYNSGGTTYSSGNMAELQRQLQADLSRQLNQALNQESHSSYSYTPQNYQSSLQDLSDQLNRNLTKHLQEYSASGSYAAYGNFDRSQMADLRAKLEESLMNQLRQGLQQSMQTHSSYSSSSSSSSSSSNSAGYRPAANYQMGGYSSDGTCCQGDNRRYKRSPQQQTQPQDIGWKPQGSQVPPPPKPVPAKSRSKRSPQQQTQPQDIGWKPQGSQVPPPPKPAPAKSRSQRSPQQQTQPQDIGWKPQGSQVPPPPKPAPAKSRSQRSPQQQTQPQDIGWKPQGSQVPPPPKHAPAKSRSKREFGFGDGFLKMKTNLEQTQKDLKANFEQGHKDFTKKAEEVGEGIADIGHKVFNWKPWGNNGHPGRHDNGRRPWNRGQGNRYQQQIEDQEQIGQQQEPDEDLGQRQEQGSRYSKITKITHVGQHVEDLGQEQVEDLGQQVELGQNQIDLGQQLEDNDDFSQHQIQRNKYRVSKIIRGQSHSQIGQQTEDLGQQTEDLGQQLEDGENLGHQRTRYSKITKITHIGQNAEDLGQEQVDLGQQVELGQNQIDLGQQLEDNNDFSQHQIQRNKYRVSKIIRGHSQSQIGQQTEDLGQQTEDLGQQLEDGENLGRQRTRYSKITKITHVGQHAENLGQQQVEDLGQQVELGQNQIDLGQQLEDNDDFSQHQVRRNKYRVSKIIRGQSQSQIGQQTEDLGQQQVEDFGQQQVELGQSQIDLGQQLEDTDFGQQLEDGEDLGHQGTRYSKITRVTKIIRGKTHSKVDQQSENLGQQQVEDLGQLVDTDENLGQHQIHGTGYSKITKIIRGGTSFVDGQQVEDLGQKVEDQQQQQVEDVEDLGQHQIHGTGYSKITKIIRGGTSFVDGQQVEDLGQKVEDQQQQQVEDVEDTTDIGQKIEHVLHKVTGGKLHLKPLDQGQQVEDLSQQQQIDLDQQQVEHLDFGQKVENVLSKVTGGKLHLKPLDQGQQVEDLSQQQQTDLDQQQVEHLDFGQKVENVLHQVTGGKVHLKPLNQGQQVEDLSQQQQTDLDQQQIEHLDFGQKVENVLHQVTGGKLHLKPIDQSQQVEDLSQQQQVDFGQQIEEGGKIHQTNGGKIQQKNLDQNQQTEDLSQQQQIDFGQQIEEETTTIGQEIEETTTVVYQKVENIDQQQQIDFGQQIEETHLDQSKLHLKPLDQSQQQEELGQEQEEVNFTIGPQVEDDFPHGNQGKIQIGGSQDQEQEQDTQQVEQQISGWHDQPRIQQKPLDQSQEPTDTQQVEIFDVNSVKGTDDHLPKDILKKVKFIEDKLSNKLEAAIIGFCGTDRLNVPQMRSELINDVKKNITEEFNKGFSRYYLQNDLGLTDKQIARIQAILLDRLLAKIEEGVERAKKEHETRKTTTIIKTSQEPDDTGIFDDIKPEGSIFQSGHRTIIRNRTVITTHTTSGGASFGITDQGQFISQPKSTQGAENEADSLITALRNLSNSKHKTVVEQEPTDNHVNSYSHTTVYQGGSSIGGYQEQEVQTGHGNNDGFDNQEQEIQTGYGGRGSHHSSIYSNQEQEIQTGYGRNRHRGSGYDNQEQEIQSGYGGHNRHRVSGLDYQEQEIQTGYGNHNNHHTSSYDVQEQEITGYGGHGHISSSHSGYGGRDHISSSHSGYDHHDHNHGYDNHDIEVIHSGSHHTSFDEPLSFNHHDISDSHSLDHHHGGYGHPEYLDIEDPHSHYYTRHEVHVEEVPHHTHSHSYQQEQEIIGQESGYDDQAQEEESIPLPNEQLQSSSQEQQKIEVIRHDHYDDVNAVPSVSVDQEVEEPHHHDVIHIEEVHVDQENSVPPEVYEELPWWKKAASKIRHGAHKVKEGAIKLKEKVVGC